LRNQKIEEWAGLKPAPYDAQNEKRQARELAPATNWDVQFCVVPLGLKNSF
jgi:hypothetical protein